MSLGDSGALVDAGGAAIGDDEPPGVRLRYLTKKTIATMTATTKTIMNVSVTQPPPLIQSWSLLTHPLPHPGAVHAGLHRNSKGTSDGSCAAGARDRRPAQDLSL